MPLIGFTWRTEYSNHSCCILHENSRKHLVNMLGAKQVHGTNQHGICLRFISLFHPSVYSFPAKHASEPGEKTRAEKRHLRTAGTQCLHIALRGRPGQRPGFGRQEANSTAKSCEVPKNWSNQGIRHPLGFKCISQFRYSVRNELEELPRTLVPEGNQGDVRCPSSSRNSRLDMMEFCVNTNFPVIHPSMGDTGPIMSFFEGL